MRSGPLPKIIQLNSGSGNNKNSEPMQTIHQPSPEVEVHGAQVRGC